LFGWDLIGHCNKEGKMERKTFIFMALSVFVDSAVHAQAMAVRTMIPKSEALFAPQETRSWCWAACNQMMLSAAGVRESQTNQANKRVALFGGLLDQGAGTDYRQAMPCLSGKYTKVDGTTVSISARVSYLKDRNPTDPIVILNALKRGWPVVMATAAHGRVCVGVDYVTDGISYQITQLYLLDPADREGKVRTMAMSRYLEEGGFGFMTFERIEVIR
jgi:hypothetical protein